MGWIRDYFLRRFPYTDFHELNADWLIATVKELIIQLDNFVTLNTIKYADPIQWSITRQYETNTVVIDPVSGVAYLSVKPVPMGVALTNTDYWTQIFDLGEIIGNINRNLTLHNDGYSTTSTFDLDTSDWVLWNGVLYEAMHHIDIGDAYVPDANIKKKSVEELVNAYISSLYTYIGSLSDLDTNDKDSIVDAINEVVSNLAAAISDFNTKIGDLANLNTTDKTNVVAAINEVLTTLSSAISTINATIGTLANLNTTDKSSIVAAINELYTYAHNSVDIINTRTGWLTDLNTTDKSNLVAAINEVKSNVGNLPALTTTNKNDTVAAINEVNQQAANIAGVVNRLANRKIIFIGDSYMHGDSGNQSAEYTPFVTIACNNLGLTLNSDYWVSAVGGTGFTTSPTNFLTQLTGVSVPSESAITDIIVFGGYNDNTETADTIKAAIQSFCSYAHGRFAHAKVHIGMFANTYNPTKKETLNAILEAYSGTLADYAFINNSQYALHNYSWFTTDSVHPNQYGQNQMAMLLEHYLVNNEMSVTYPFITVSTAAGNFDVALNAKMKCTNNITTLIIEDTDVSNAALTIDCSGATRYNFGYLNSGYIRGCDSLNFNLQCFALLENSVVTPMTIEFKVTGGVLYGYPQAYVYNAGGSPRISALSGKATLLKVIGCNISLDTLNC